MASEKIYYDNYLINFSSDSGYPTIFVNGKNTLLHRYVWEKNFGEIPKGYEIHHKDKNRTNYTIENLELVNVSLHRKKHAVENKLGKSNEGIIKNHVSGYCSKRREIVAKKDDTIIYFPSVYKAAQTLNVRSGDVVRILKGLRKSSKGWRFEYVT